MDRKDELKFKIENVVFDTAKCKVILFIRPDRRDPARACFFALVRNAGLQKRMARYVKLREVQFGDR